MRQEFYAPTALKNTDLEKAVNDGSRKIRVRGRQAIVPMKIDKNGDLVHGEIRDEKGNLIKAETPAELLVLKRVTLTDLAFLSYWKEQNYTDAEGACKKAGISVDQAQRLIQKLAPFQEEEEYVKTLFKVITPGHILFQHIKNSVMNHLDDGQRDSLKEATKIIGGYKPTTNVQVNVTAEMPKLSPDQEKAAREFFDTIAIEGTQHAA